MQPRPISETVRDARLRCFIVRPAFVVDLMPRVSSSLEALSDEERRLVRPAGPPKAANAMKAVLTDERFSDPNWIYERKLDGIRCIAVRTGDRLMMLSRNDLSLNARYPELAEEL